MVDKYRITPLIMILSGFCRVINPHDDYEVITVKRGEIIGECDLLRSVVSKLNDIKYIIRAMNFSVI